jgi:glycosyltransferase involved in cell wall biosynthesis
MIKKKFNLPICFQTGDDWPFSLYRNSPIVFIKPLVTRAVQTLLNNSSARLANGKLMAEVYEKRYNMTFEPLMMCDDPLRFHEAPTKRIVGEKTKSIVYTGNLGHGRWNSIVELCEAVKMIKLNEYEIMVTAFATTIPPEAVNTLQDISNLQILPAPSHTELPSVLKGADILFLPETFDPVMALEIRLSISTKAHFYMMSQKPILVYASLVTGIADYAKEQSWAFVVEHHDLEKLAKGIEKLLTDKAFSDRLITKGNEVFQKNHAEKNVRKRFLHIFQDVISPPCNN